MTDLFDEQKSKDDDKSIDDKSKGKKQEETVETYLGLILNEEGKQKYTTAEEALKGSVHAQNHIATLEKELKDLREKDDKDTGMEKILEALKGKPEDKSEETPQGVTEEQLADVVTKLLDQRESTSTQEQNITTVVGVFKKLYGDKASETMYGKAKDLGFNQEGINQLIATNPKAALKILGVEDKKGTESDSTDSQGVNTDGFQQKGEETPESSMGYVSGKQLQTNWEKSQAATNKRLGVETTS